MTKRINSYRHRLMRDNDADFVTYQRNSGNGVWQTVSVWWSRNSFLEGTRQGGKTRRKPFA